MKGRHLIQVKPQRICLFCLSRLQNAAPSPSSAILAQHRSISSSNQRPKPPAQAAAQREEDVDDYQQEAPQVRQQQPRKPTPFRALASNHNKFRPAFEADSADNGPAGGRSGTFAPQQTRDSSQSLSDAMRADAEKERSIFRRSDQHSGNVQNQNNPQMERGQDRGSFNPERGGRWQATVHRDRKSLGGYSDKNAEYDKPWSQLPQRNKPDIVTPTMSSPSDRRKAAQEAYFQNKRALAERNAQYVGFKDTNGQSQYSDRVSNSHNQLQSKSVPGSLNTTEKQPAQTTRRDDLTRLANEQEPPSWRKGHFSNDTAKRTAYGSPLNIERSFDRKPRERFDSEASRPRQSRDPMEEPKPENRNFKQNRQIREAMPKTMDATPKRRNKDRDLNRRAEKFETPDSMYEEIPTQKKDQKKKQGKKDKLDNKRASAPTPIEIPPFISVSNLAMLLKVRIDAFAEKLEELGFEDIANDHVLNAENAGLVAMEYNFEPIVDTSEVDDLKPRPPTEDVSLLQARPPVVTIMGHVDHGKTTLLDYLRKSSVAANEHGGITQHIGAFSVQLESGKQITFLDTPGHAAFLSMRQRGANVTDIVILVVAADDSVKPQTIEAIKHAKQAKVPIIVAINKVDKPEADVQRVKTDLMRHEIEVEEFGGDIQAIEVSGKTGQGMADLEEAAVTLAEILDMKADYEGLAEGWVLEATTKKSGRVATVLVKRGTLRPGDSIVAGRTWAKIRTLKNEAGMDIFEATPGTPVEVDGWREQPVAGDEVLGAVDEHKATSVVDYRVDRDTRVRLAEDSEAINDQRRIDAERQGIEKKEKEEAVQIARDTKTRVDWKPTAQVEDPDKPTDLYCIIKADVWGSAEAVQGTLDALPLVNNKLKLNILRTGVGSVLESDVGHIDTVPSGNGFIVNFNQQVPQNIQNMADRAGIRMFDENIIYKVLDNVKEMIEDRLPPVVKSRVTGEAEIAQTFEINEKKKIVKVAGCRIRNGVLTLNKKVRVYRGGDGAQGELVHDGTISSLKSHKKEVSEMRKGAECGLGFDNWEDFQAGDVIQCYEEIFEKRRLM